jgi:hypothetical protein
LQQPTQLRLVVEVALAQIVRLVLTAPFRYLVLSHQLVAVEVERLVEIMDQPEVLAVVKAEPVVAVLSRTMQRERLTKDMRVEQVQQQTVPVAVVALAQ